MFESNAGERGVQGLWNKLLSLFNSGKDEVVRSSKISKARLDLSSLKKDRERVFVRLGEELYKKYKEKAISIPGLALFFTEIDIIDTNLSSKERELKVLKGEEADLVSERKVIPIRPEKREGSRSPRRRPSEPKQDGSVVESGSNNMGL